MSISPGMLFFTPQTGGGQAVPPGLQGRALTGGNGIFSTMQGLAFFDLLFSTPAQTETGENPAAAQEPGMNVPAFPFLHKPVVTPAAETDATDQSAGILQAVSYEAAGTERGDVIHALPGGEELLPDGTAAPAPAETLLLPVETTDISLAGAGQPVSADTATDTPPAVHSSVRQKFFAFLRQLLAGLPEDSKPQVFNIASGKPQKNAPLLQFAPDTGAETPANLLTSSDVNEKLENAGNENAPAPALIATGLDPQELTDFIDDILKRVEAGESVVIGLIRLLPPPAKNDAIVFPRGLFIPGAPKAATPETPVPAPAAAPEGTDGAETEAPAPDAGTLESELNALTVGGDEEQPETGTGKTAGAAPNGFEKILKILEQAQQPSQVQSAQQQQQASPPQDKPLPSPGLSAVRQHVLPVLGLEFAGSTSGNIYPDGFDWSQSPVSGAGQALTVSGSGPMTSLINHASQATQTHPAVQVIAATISKAAGDGVGKNFTLKLDPPDLGRIEIRMAFSKDKTLKTHMLVEKQETYFMLQRDAQALERALQNAGLDVDGGTSFELAQDSGMFNQNNDGRGGSNDSGGSSSSDGAEDDLEIIESTMTWTVDSQTGLTHYEIWA